ncbi:MAG: porin [Longimicrobiales bacterium]
MRLGTTRHRLTPHVPFRRLRRAGSICAFALAAFLPTAAELAAQPVEPRVPVERAEFGGRAHIQFNSTSVDGEPGTEFLVRRARIWAAARVNDWIDGAVLVDLAGADASARYAFVRFALAPTFRVSVGQFKRAFDMFELMSSSDMILVERDGVVRGVEPCAGVGGPCTYSRFSERLQLSSLDIGALVQGEASGGRLGYLVSVTNGSGPNTREDNDAKSVAGRVTWSATDAVVFGANANLHDFDNAVTRTTEHAQAFALDVEVGGFSRGLHAQAAVLGGDNWRNLDPSGHASRFLAAQGVLSYRVPVAGGGRIDAVEPLGRISWGDPDRGTVDDGGVMLTPGLALHFGGKNKLITNIDVWRPDSDRTAWSLKTTALMYF